MTVSRARLHDFYSLYVELRAVPTELPFELGGATQMGQLGDHHNNQDALALLSERAHMVAVVADGCASGGLRHSHNEVGAKFQAMLLADMLDEALANGSVQQVALDLPIIEERLLEDLRSIIATLSAHPKAPSNAALSQSFFTATLLAAVIDAEHYVVFGCGDGVLWINDRCINLDGQEGRYLSERLVRPIDAPAADSCTVYGLEPVPAAAECRGNSPPDDAVSNGGSDSWPGKPMMRVLCEGATAELNRLFLATDGFLDVFERYPTLLERFVPSSHSQEGHPGYNEHLVSEFRRKFWYDDGVEAWALNLGAHDDRTFALIRRATKVGLGVDPCSN